MGAEVAELADARRLGRRVLYGRGGSSPLLGTDTWTQIIYTKNNINQDDIGRPCSSFCHL